MQSLRTLLEGTADEAPGESGNRYRRLERHWAGVWPGLCQVRRKRGAGRLAKDGIRVNAVCPAGVLTPLMNEWAESQYDPQAALRWVEDC
jgi:hypothetical protein